MNGPIRFAVAAATLIAAGLMPAACSDDSSTSDRQEFEIGSEGGTIEYTHPDNENVSLELIIPAGSVDDGTTITVEPADEGDYPDDDDLAPFTAFEFGPSGLTFDPPATLTITYDEDELGGLEESELTINKVVDGGWTALDSTVDTDANTVSAEIDSFSFWAILRRIFQALSGPTVEQIDPDGTDCDTPTVIFTGAAISISFSESMDTDSLQLGGMLGSGESRDGEDDGGVWSTTSESDDTLTISPQPTWTTGAFDFKVDAEDPDGNALDQLSLCYSVLSGGGTPEE